MTFLRFFRLTFASRSVFSAAEVVKRSSHKMISTDLSRPSSILENFKTFSACSPRLLFIFFGKPITIFSMSWVSTSCKIAGISFFFPARFNSGKPLSRPFQFITERNPDCVIANIQTKYFSHYSMTMILHPYFKKNARHFSSVGH